MQTRSGRQTYAQRPSLQAHPQQSSSSSTRSAASSLYPSSTSLATLQTGINDAQSTYTMPSAQQQQLQLQLQMQMQMQQQQQQQHQQQHQQQRHMSTSSAPMPSPSASNGLSATGYFAVSKSSQADPYATQRAAAAAAASATQSPETAPFLRDFTLLAEAAKRAQMACLARDMGDIGL